MLWAVPLNWYDGLVARGTPERSEHHKLLGVRMDSLVDLISLAVGPAILLFCVGEFSGWFYPGALALLLPAFFVSLTSMSTVSIRVVPESRTYRVVLEGYTVFPVKALSIRLEYRW